MTFTTRIRNVLAATLVALAAVVAPPAGVRAQGDAMFTQYWAVPTYYNPAATGTVDFIRIRGGAKLQWIGIDNAPRTFMGAADMPVKLGKKQCIGVGVLFNQESIGLYRNMGITMATTTNSATSSGSSKACGASACSPDSITPSSRARTSTFPRATTSTSPTTPSSPPPAWRTRCNDAEGIEFQAVLPRQAYFTAEGNIPLRNSLFSLQPSLLLRTDFNTFTPEATMRATYNRFLSFGVGYRYKEAISAMVAVEFKNFFLGYA